MASGPGLGRRGVYVAVMVGATVMTLLLHSLDRSLLGSALYLLALAGVLLHAFVSSGQDTRPAQTWADAWRPRHLLMIALSFVIAFSALLVPDAGETAWVLLPILLACVPLLFTPLARIGETTASAEE